MATATASVPTPAQIVGDQQALVVAQNALTSATASGDPTAIAAATVAVQIAQLQVNNDNAAVKAASPGVAPWVYWTVGGVALLGGVLIVHHYSGRSASPNRRRRRHRR